MSVDLSSQFIFWSAALALLGIFASILSRRLGAPLLLLFLVLGMLAGEDGPGGIQFNDFGLAFLFGNLALAIILFDGGLGTRRSSFRVSLGPATSLATLGVVITAALTGVAAHQVLDLPWQEALLVGAIVGSTDAAAVFGLLGSAGLELKERTEATLEMESGANDPMAIFLTITLVQLIAGDSSNPGWTVLVEFVRQMGLGVIAGFAGGHAFRFLLTHLILPGSLYPLFALAGGLTVFGLTNLCGGSGFLAVYILGVILGNTTLPYGKDIHRFHDGMAWLSQIGMFLMLGLLITPSHLQSIISPALVIALVLILIARPFAVAISLAPFHFPWRDQIFISWCGLRGAVPIILALFPLLAGLEHSRLYFELAFFVVLVSLVLQGWTIAPLAKYLRIELPPTHKKAEHLVLPIPNDQGKALLVYHAAPGCPAIGMDTRKLPLTEGAQLVGVLRRGVMLATPIGECIQEHDHVVLLAAEETLSALDRTFDSELPGEVRDNFKFYGEFGIDPHITLLELSQFYGFIADEQERALSVADFLAETFHGKPVIGDRTRLGKVELVVKGVKGDTVVAVGLKLPS